MICAHRGIEAAWRVHAQHDDADVARRRAVQFPHDIVGDRRTDRAVDLEHQGAFGGPRRHGERRKHHGQKHDYRARTHHGNLPGPAAPVAQSNHILSWSRERVSQGGYDIATASRGAPIRCAPNGMRCTARTVIQLNTSAPPNTIATLITANSAVPSNAYCSHTTRL